MGEVAFERIGFNSLEYALILVGTLIGSTINIPVAEARGEEPILLAQEVRGLRTGIQDTTDGCQAGFDGIAVNVGGAAIPLLVSIYLLAGHPSLLAEAAFGSFLTAILVHLMARKVKGVGIVTQPLCDPSRLH